MRRPRIGKMVQNTFTSAKTAALVAVIIIGLSFGWKGSSAAQTSAWWDAWSNGWKPEVAQPGLHAVGALAGSYFVRQSHGRSNLRANRLDERDLPRE